MATPIHQRGGAQQAAAGAQNVGKMAGLMGAAQRSGGVLLRILKDFVGPLALATGAATGFLGILVKAVVRAEVLQRSLERIAKINYYAPSFAKLLGGLDAAKRRLAQLSAAAARGPFAFDDLVQGNRTLQIFTRGTLAGKRGMDLMEDAAAAGGTSVAQMSAVVGTLYDDIANGRPIDAGIRQLQALGVISRNAADQLLLQREAGLSNAAMWSAVEREISRTKGSSAALGKELGGLQQKLENTRAEQERTIGQMFESGQKNGLEAQIAIVESMTPVLQAALAPFAGLYNGFNRITAAAATYASKIPGLKEGVAAVVSGLVALSAALVGIAFVQAAGLVVMLTKLLFGWAAAAATATGATGLLARAVIGLRGAIMGLISPLGMVLLAIGAVAGGLLEAGSNSDRLADKQRALKAQIDETSKALREQIDGTKTQADRATNVSEAQKRVIDIEQQLAAAKEEARKQEEAGRSQGRLVGEFWNKNLFGKKTGAEQAQENVAALEAEREAAMKQAVAAMNAPTSAALESLMGEDYQRAKEASKKKIEALQAEFEQLSQRKAFVTPESARAIEDRQSAISAEIAGEADRFSKDNLNREFEKRQALTAANIRSMREIARQTGDRGLRERANEKEDSAFRERRQRDLIEQGFGRNEASAMAERDMLVNAAERLREQQGQAQVSSMAAVGGSAGFAGLVTDIQKQQLDRLQAIEQELKRLNEGGEEDKFTP